MESILVDLITFAFHKTNFKILREQNTFLLKQTPTSGFIIDSKLLKYVNRISIRCIKAAELVAMRLLRSIISH